MEMTRIEVDEGLTSQGRAPTAFVGEPELNETQRVLLRALLAFGPNGEHWCQGTLSHGITFCARGAINLVLNGDPDKFPEGTSRKNVPCYFVHLENAALALMPDWEYGRGKGDASVWLNNNAADFSEVRNMFLRAIELAGETAQAQVLREQSASQQAAE